MAQIRSFYRIPLNKEIVTMYGNALGKCMRGMGNADRYCRRPQSTAARIYSNLKLTQNVPLRLVLSEPISLNLRKLMF